MKYPRPVERAFTCRVAAAALLMTAVLLADSAGATRQVLLAAVTALFLIAYARRAGVESRQILCAIVVASIGEVVLSLGWGLYTYQHALIPLYVPPGHGLFYTLALDASRQRWFRDNERTITRATLAAGTFLAAFSLVIWNDQWGTLWWIAAAALLASSRNKSLLCACFVFTILLEWAGTANSNWLWAPVVPGLGLHSANPPAGVGILYILLDLITVAICSRWLAGSRPSISGYEAA